MLHITYVRDGRLQTVASVTTGFGAESSVVRAPDGRILGTASNQFNVTRDASGRLVSTNTADPGLLLNSCRRRL